MRRSGSNQDSSNRSTQEMDNKFNNSLYTLPVIKPPLAQAESDSLLSLNNSLLSLTQSPLVPLPAFLPPVASRPEKTKSIVSFFIYKKKCYKNLTSLFLVH